VLELELDQCSLNHVPHDLAMKCLALLDITKNDDKIDPAIFKQ